MPAVGATLSRARRAHLSRHLLLHVAQPLAEARAAEEAEMRAELELGAGRTTAERLI